MPYDPLNVIVEILGEPAADMRNPANAGYQCPFISSECTKRSQQTDGPYPVCSIFRGTKKGKRSDRPPICLCPNRFYERQIQDDVIAHAWTGPPPVNPRVVHEVTMQKFGRVDFVLSDYDEATGTITRFLPVELQAVDITRTVYPAYTAITNSTPLDARPQYGFNWGNVRKRYLSQLISKGYYCHHWETRIVAVLQEDLFDEFDKHAAVAEVSLEASNIVFLLYQFTWLDAENRWELKFKRRVPTTHANLKDAILYEKPPAKAKFEKRILEKILLGDSPVGIPTLETIGELLPDEPTEDESAEDEE